MSRFGDWQNVPEVMTKVSEVYEPDFPLEVRYFLSQWIESQDWNSIDVSNPHSEVRARQLLEQMLMELRAKTANLAGAELFTVRHKLEAAASNFQARYQNDVLGFVKKVWTCLQAEDEIFQAAERGLQPAQDIADAAELPDPGTAAKEEIREALQALVSKVQQQERKFMEMQNGQENFILQYQENVKLTTQIQTLGQQSQTREIENRIKILRRQKEQLEQELSREAQQLLQLRISMADMFSVTINELQEVQHRVLDDELISWKRKQQLSGNGLRVDSSSLDTLQFWCEHLAEIIWQMRQQIKKNGILRAQLPIDLPPGQSDLLPELNDQITGLLSSLVTSTFIVETQPPQVLKKEARFSATVRLLVGGKLNVHMNPPQIRATIISEHQAKSLLRSDMKAKQETSGEILNNTGTMEFHPGNGECCGFLVAQFRNMQLKRIKRSDKRGSEAVTEEKFCILFQSDFNVGGNDLVFQVWTLSLPVVVTVHGNQECNALATVLWDNAFSEPGRVPFVVPDSVLWPKLGEQLNLRFASGTGRGLSEDNLQYLASKMFGQRNDYTQSAITWAMFNKEQLKDRNFTFWEWFYAVYKLTKEHLKGPWCDGSIMGFVGKMQAQELLHQRPNGTFLLRFSDSECGGITIAWIAEGNKNPNEREVWNLAPFVSRDFTIRGLADRIRDLQNLTYLYPDIPKNAAFSKYYNTVQEQQTSTANGYIRPHLVNVISMPPSNAAPMAEENPQTPQPLSVAPTTPQSCTEDSQMVEDMAAMDNFTDMLASTDYDPHDIENINMNQLLQSFYNDYQPKT